MSALAAARPIQKLNFTAPKEGTDRNKIVNDALAAALKSSP